MTDFFKFYGPPFRLGEPMCAGGDASSHSRLYPPLPQRDRRLSRPRWISYMPRWEQVYTLQDT